MPVATKAAAALARHITGGLAFNSVEDVAYLGPLGNRTTVPREKYDEFWHGAYAALIESIDWNRVLIEATSTHLRAQRDDPLHAEDAYDDALCPDCLRLALLARDRDFGP